MVEPAISLRTLIGDADPHELIENNLVATVLDPEHQWTTKFLVTGHPDVLVRLNPGTPPAQIRKTAAAIYALPQDIPRLPHWPIEHRDEAYVFTQFVTGKTLLDALRGRDSDRLVDESDQVWTALGGYTLASLRSGQPSPADIEGADQYMYGTVSTDKDTKKIRCVDLGTHVLNLSEDPGGLGETTMTLAHAMVDIEHASGGELVQARLVMAELIQRAYGFPESEQEAEAAEASLAEHQKLQLRMGELRNINED